MHALTHEDEPLGLRAAADGDPIKRLLRHAREMKRTPRSPVITSNSTDVKYARALQAVRKYGIDV
jgi:hypothetical protein